MVNDIKVQKDLPEYGLFPEDCRGGPTRCPSCGDFCANYLSGFIKNLFMLKVVCEKCKLDCVYTEVSPGGEPHNRWVRRAKLEAESLPRIKSGILEKKFSQNNNLYLRIHHGTREGIAPEIVKLLPQDT